MAVIVFGWSASSASATTLPTTISQDTTLTAANSPYSTAGTTVSAGVTLTIEPGVAVRGTSTSAKLTINGTLDAQGTTADPISFSASNDAYSVSWASRWGGVIFNSSSTGSVIDHAEVRYASNSIQINSASPQITNTTIRANAYYGIGVFGASAPQIANNTVAGNRYSGIYFNAPGTATQSSEVRIHDNDVENNGGYGIAVTTGSNSYVIGTTLADNTVSGNSNTAIYYNSDDNDPLPTDIDENPTPTGNGTDAIVLRGTVAQTSSWEDHGYPIIIGGGNLTVGSGSTLNLGPGLVLKGTAQTSGVVVNGALNANGTAADPVTFTSILDDSAGGDTNGDGSASQPAGGNWRGLYYSANSSGGTLDHARVAYGSWIYYGRPMIEIACPCPNPPTISNSVIERSADTGIEMSPITSGGSLHVTDSVIRNNADVGLSAQSGSPVISGNVVSGNGYEGIFAVSTPQGEITGNTATANGRAGIRVEGVGGVIHDNIVEDNLGAGITAKGDDVTVRANTIRNNGAYGIVYTAALSQAGVQNDLGKIPADIDENTIVGNGNSNAIQVSGTLDQSASWEDGTFVIAATNLTIPAGSALDLGAGVVFKGGTSSRGIVVNGALNANGTAADPVNFTSINDDSVGGDTDGYGSATQPDGDDWRGIIYSAGSAGGTLDHARVAYGSWAYYADPMIEVNCPCPTPPRITNSTIEHSAKMGIYVTGTPGGTQPIVEWSKIRHNATAGAWYSGSGTLSLPHNDWGCASGPAPKGCGNRISNNIDSNPDSGGAESNCQGQDHQCPSDGDPVSLATGAFTYAHTDLSLSNKGDSPLEFVRSYNSSDASDAGLGPGWSHAGLMRAIELEHGDVLIRRADGRQDRFVLLAGGDYRRPSGVSDTLSKQPDGTFLLKTVDRIKYRFGASSRLASITDDHGLVTTYGYDSNGRLANITDPSGQELSFGYDSSNHITGIADSTGRHVDFTYTAAGDLDTVTDALGGITDYGYDGQHRLTTIEDPRGITFLTNSYDGQGRVSEQTDALNNLWTIDYGAGETTVTDPENGDTAYSFDSQNRLTSVTNPLGHTTNYSYDADGNVDQITEPGGAITAASYDAAGNLTSVTDPENGQRTFAYDELNRLTSFTDERNKTWDYTWDSSNDLTDIEDPATEMTSITYDSAGRPLTVTDPLDHETAMTYDSRGNLLTKTDPLGHTTTLGYDARNYLTSLTRPGLAAETYTRNGLGDLLSMTTPEGHTTSYGYDANGALTSVTDPALNEWQIIRDGMEHPTKYVDPLLNETTIAYDGNLQPTSLTDRNGHITTYSYDDAGQLTEVDPPATGVWQIGYDARGNRDELVDPRSHATTYDYDLADRLVAVDEPLGSSTDYGYDAAGNLTSLTDPNSHQTSFTYDPLGQLTEIDQPLGKTTTFAYDAAGNMTGRTTAGDALALAYDDDDRLTSVADATSTLRSYGYDAADRLAQATDAQAKTLSFGYDDDDNLTTVADDRGQSAIRSFDSRGNLTAQADGRGTISYAYDELSRISSLTDPSSDVVGFGYDDEGNLTSTELPNGVTTSNTYDGANRMTGTESLNGSSVLQRFDYVYDASGNRTSVTDRNNDQTTYSYDALNRLTQWDPPSTPAVDYGYDAAGNRISADGVTYSYNALNQLVDDSSGTTYGYDDAGRLASETNGADTNAYEWDALDQLVEFDDGAAAVSYSYDALGRRADRITNGDTETAHYADMTDRASVDTDAAGVIRTFISGPTGLLEQQNGSTTSFVLADAHNDVTALVDPSGTVASRHEYEPWGTQLTGSALEMGWLGGHGRRSERIPNLIQMGFRSYDPLTGRFDSEDSVINAAAMSMLSNRYQYAILNPVNITDLRGRTIFDDVGDFFSSWWEDPLNFGNPAEMVGPAGDWWEQRAVDAVGSGRACTFPIRFIFSGGISTDNDSIHPIIGVGLQAGIGASCNDGPTADVSVANDACVVDDGGGLQWVPQTAPTQMGIQGYTCAGFGINFFSAQFEL